MNRLSRLFPAVLLVLAAHPAAAQLRAGPKASLPQLVARQPLQTGPKTPTLLRADQPDRPPADATTGDPSLIPDYNSTADGINTNGVGRLQTPVPNDPGFAFFCTAARIGPSTFITAAHCVTDEDTGALLSTTNQSTIRLLGPGSTLASPQPVTFTASSVVVRPEWRGFFTEATSPDGRLGYDVALLNFNFVLPSWITTYDLFGGDPFFENTTNVGYGTYGNGDQGGIGFDGRRRWGQNAVDFYTDDFSSLDWNILYTDFDDGTFDHDAFCFVSFFLCDPGRGPTEMGTAPGDSGGPLFINGQLAAVTSFGTYLCGNAQCDPASPPLKDPNVTDGFGAINGFAGVLGNEDWIRANATTTPEPSSLALLGGGLLALAGAAYRRRNARG